MSKIEVEGMHRLCGEVQIQGSKNAVLPILSACVLNRGETVLHKCPKIEDVSSMLEVLAYAGVKSIWEGDTLILNTEEMQSVPLIEKTDRMRSSVMLLGSFLARFGTVTLGYPGGCCIGKRPIDLHEQVLEAMGVSFQEKEDRLEAVCEHLEGCDLFLPYSSVGVTENILLAAAGASGMTRIYGAAREPEIVELCRFLATMGIRIYGIGTEKLFVMGAKCQTQVEYTVCSDRIVAGTYLFAAIAAGGEIILRDAPLEHMRKTIQIVHRLGGELKRDGNDVKLRMKERANSIPYLVTAPYPGFPTDLQSPLLAVLCRAEGKSCIEEQIFENRFRIVEELKKMGAEIYLKDRKAYLFPVKKLEGRRLEVRELRGGAALIIAALQAEGNSELGNAQILQRGYENIVEDFCKLGAVIHRKS